MSKNTKMIIGSVVAVILLAVGSIFSRVSMAEIVLPAERITNVLGFNVTNTFLATWATLIVLTVLSYLATRKMEVVPRGFQNLFEFVLEALLGLVEGVAGKENGRRFFPLIASIFLFVLVSNWMGLLPGYGTIGVVESGEGGHVLASAGPIALLLPNAKEVKAEPVANNEATHESANAPANSGGEANTGEPVTPAKPVSGPGQDFVGIIVPFLRSANTDLNTTIALAIVAVFMSQFWGISSLGLFGYGGKFINLKEGPIGFFVGVLEIISEFAKLISFSFRLFGNIFAGEVLMSVIVFLVPWLAQVPFMGLELFVGFVQALVFAMLTLVFVSMAVTPHHGHGEGEHAGH